METQSWTCTLCGNSHPGHMPGCHYCKSSAGKPGNSRLRARRRTDYRKPQRQENDPTSFIKEANMDYLDTRKLP